MENIAQAHIHNGLHRVTGAYCPPPDQGLTLHYQDEALLVVEKPAGLLAVPGRGTDKQDCLLRRVQSRFPEAITVHRLDMGTSGLMVFARGKATERALSILFQTRQVQKCYIAVVAGQLAKASGEINLPLATDWTNRPRQMVCFAHGKPSLTRYTLLNYDAARDSSRLALEPVTGRSHQLRVHLQVLGHPILGDELYAGEHCQRAQRLLLHTHALSFPHQHSAVSLTFTSPVPF
ncbi:MAG: pseudouridine synthase [Thiothrix sp.]